MTLSRAIGSAVTLALICLAAPPTALAAKAWSPPVELPGHAGGFPQIAALSDGSEIVVTGPRWKDFQTTGPMLASISGPAGGFSPPEPIASGSNIWLWEVVPGPAGSAAVLYSYDEPGDEPPLPGLVVRTPASGFENTAPLPASDHVAAGFDAAGRLTLAMQRAEESEYSFQAFTRGLDGTIGEPRKIASTGGHGWYLNTRGLAVAADGTTTAAWRTGNGSNRVLAATAPPGGEFGPAETIASKSYSSFGDVKVAGDAAGNALAAWLGGSQISTGPPGHPGSLLTAFKPAGERWRAPQPILGDTPGDGTSNSWSLAMNRRGDAVLAWVVGARLSMSYRPAGGEFEPATLGPEAEYWCCEYPQAAIGPNGDAIVVAASGTNETESGLDTIDHPSGGSFQPPQRIRIPGYVESPGVAVDRFSNAVAVWRRVDSESDPDPEVWTSRHPIDPAALSDAPHPPAVSNFGVTLPSTSAVAKASAEPGAFRFRLSRTARVTIRIRRIGKHGKKYGVARISAALYRGRNRPPIPVYVARRLAHAGRYRARIVAVDRRGRRSKPRSVSFRVEKP